MPDFEDKIPISEFSYTNTLHNTDQAPIIQQDGADWDNFRTSIADIGLHINKDMEYVTDLHTTSKKIIGAINELADGGGSADIISEASGTIVTFNDGGDNIPVKSLVTDITAIQAGTGTPSPSNVRSISGFSSVVLSVKGQNYIDTSTLAMRDVAADHTQRAGYAPVLLDAGTYNLSFTFSDGVARQVYTQNADTFGAIASGNSNYSFTLNSQTNVLVRTTYLSVESATITNVTLYNANVDTTHTITLPETIYGGNASLTEGTGVKILDCVDLGDLSWSMGSSHIGFYTDLPNAIAPISSGDINAICSCYERTDSPSTTAGLPNLTFCVSDGNLTTQKRLFIRDDSYNGDVNAFKTGVTGQKLVYTLATPTAFTFTPEQIPTLSGENNIYSNCGDVEVEYFNENADQMAELIRVMTR